MTKVGFTECYEHRETPGEGRQNFQKCNNQHVGFPSRAAWIASTDFSNSRAFPPGGFPISLSKSQFKKTGFASKKNSRAFPPGGYPIKYGDWGYCLRFLFTIAVFVMANTRAHAPASRSDNQRSTILAAISDSTAYVLILFLFIIMKFYLQP